MKRWRSVSPVWLHFASHCTPHPLVHAVCLQFYLDALASINVERRTEETPGSLALRADNQILLRASFASTLAGTLFRCVPL